jgi:hypothetical protein
MFERRHDEEKIDVLRSQDQRGRKQVGYVRRVETSAEDSDAPRAEFHTRAPLANL